MNIWFTSDTHFGHKNIIGYCNRPFADVQEMDAELVRRWNVLVAPGDTVYHLGDFAFAGAQRIQELTAQLNGRVVLVMGNHDKLKRKHYLNLGFFDVLENADLLTLGYPVYMAHHPIPYTLPEGFKYQLCGHVHELWKKRVSRYSTVLNVGVDQWAYAPASMQEVIQELGLASM